MEPNGSRRCVSERVVRLAMIVCRTSTAYCMIYVRETERKRNAQTKC
jgi:hypothetical protein